MRQDMFYHSFSSLGIEGSLPSKVLEKKWDAIVELGYNPKDKTVLDVGCWDGYYSFRTFMAGAKYTLGIDTAPWGSLQWQSNFISIKSNLVKEEDFDKIRSKILDVENIETLDCKFDIILFLGVFYHLKNPISVLEKCFNMCNESIIIETAIDYNNDYPMMRLYPGNEYGRDFTNWWVPNERCMIELLKTVGFQKIKVSHFLKDRCIFYASK